MFKTGLGKSSVKELPRKGAQAYKPADGVIVLLKGIYLKDAELEKTNCFGDYQFIMYRDYIQV